MVQVDIEELKQDFNSYMSKVSEGEKILIFKEGHPIAEINPIEAPTKGRRPIGLCKGQFTVPDNFDDPLPDEIIRLFEGEE